MKQLLILYPGYYEEDGNIFSIKTKKQITVKKGKIRLTINGIRKVYDIKKIVNRKPKKLSIEEVKSLLKVNQKITFLDYNSKKKMRGIFIRPGIFSDMAPGAKIKVGKITRTISYFNIYKSCLS